MGGPCNLHNWLATQLQQAGIENHLLDNAFVQVGDWEKAQNIADGFEVAKLHAKLEQWVKQFCPVLQQLEESHNWTLDTVEYATDVVFHRQGLVKKTARSYKYYLTALGREVVASGLRLKQFVILEEFRKDRAA